MTRTSDIFQIGVTHLRPVPCLLYVYNPVSQQDNITLQM